MRRTTWSRRGRDEAGETLAEVVVSTAILGIVGIGIIGAIATVLIASDVDRKVSAGETVLRSYVAAIQEAPYADCAGAGSYAPGPVGYGPPDKYDASVTSVDYWQAPAPGAPVTPPSDTVTLTFGPEPCTSGGTDPGLQRIEARVESTGSRSTVETVTFFKRRTTVAP